MTDLPTGIDDATIATIRGASRVCFFAHYHPHGIAADHVLFYLNALKSAGFSVIVLSTATMDAAEQAKLRGAATALICRENRGLDFGGWMEAVQHFFPLTAEFLLLANDSVYGPLSDLGAFMDRLTATPADFYGVIESYEAHYHLQSWFLLLRPAAYNSRAFHRLMTSPILPTMSKLDIINTYEVGFTRDLEAEGLTYHAAWSPARSGRLARERCFNPMHMLWRRMVEGYGIPFLKIELLRDNPMHIADFHKWEDLVQRVRPELVEPIRDDLRRRQNAKRLTYRDRLRWARNVDYAFAWPEAMPFLQADDRVRSGFANKLIWHSYKALETAGRLWFRRRAFDNAAARKRAAKAVGEQR